MLINYRTLVKTKRDNVYSNKAMFIEPGDYDPSNEYITNYSDTKTIRL